MSGSSATHWKVPFEWTKETAPPDELPAGTVWATGADIAEPVGLVAAVLETSPGAEDLHAVATLGSDGAARRVLALEPGFSYLEDRWHVLMLDAAPTGFVLPVIYDGCARDALDEATIYHLGVAPAHRGAGIGRLLLRRATSTLVRHGVWRIYCDTPVNNAPMIHLFAQEGWTRLPAHERPVAAAVARQ